ncbi:predicted protein [Uncinocarpus reesii 1704]|uniref:Uncharacterized protein n=1 Tax=Uncinocarpus reesii (strain UAMH 1704) TaxID=336963 RepID=C4JH80_UNCRE|nr:uncharacterized protein UREG_02653 [Uncinocarpus reesii 1704]EEP77804.1 predicted protein [Uncinocarpus reesii 1704]
MGTVSPSPGPALTNVVVIAGKDLQFSKNKKNALDFTTSIAECCGNIMLVSSNKDGPRRPRSISKG